VEPAQLVPLPQHGADRRLAGRRQAAGANLITVLALKSLLIYFCSGRDVILQCKWKFRNQIIKKRCHL
jgi:hypothetical protein